jgi:hypothetical protein
MCELMAGSDGWEKMNKPKQPSPMSREEYEDLKSFLDKSPSNRKRVK